jgi:hypothetical protein
MNLDFKFLNENDITNFTVQLIVERIYDKPVDHGVNSFISEDGKYLYHFAISDFTETYLSKGFIAKKMTLNSSEYCKSMLNFLTKHVLIQKINKNLINL